MRFAKVRVRNRENARQRHRHGYGRILERQCSLPAKPPDQAAAGLHELDQITLRRRGDLSNAHVGDDR